MYLGSSGLPAPQMGMCEGLAEPPRVPQMPPCGAPFLLACPDCLNPQTCPTSAFMSPELVPEFSLLPFLCLVPF
jgi:hypothetical protein